MSILTKEQVEEVRKYISASMQDMKPITSEPKVKILADSLSPTKKRLTTFELTFWRPILPELSRHRCVVGSTILKFDLPAGTTRVDSPWKVYSMSMEEFWDKWENGCAPRIHPTRQAYDLSVIDPEKEYYSSEIADLLGISKTNIHADCRLGLCKHHREFNNPSVRAGFIKILGKDFIEYRQRKESTLFRYSVRNRLSNMQLRCYDELTGTVHHTNVVNCWKTGIEPVKTLTAGNYKITATYDHLILTNNGWKELQDIIPNEDYVVVNTTKVFTEEEIKEHIKKNQTGPDGKYIGYFNSKTKEQLIEAQEGKCAICGKPLVQGYDTQVHHIKARYNNPELTYDDSNCVVLCAACHREQHKKQGWQKSYNRCNAQWELVTSIEDAGTQTVYDIEVADEQHNFFANDIVVHNCFSLSVRSSRATPVDTLIAEISNSPWGPCEWGKNQKGMVAEKVINQEEALTALKYIWYHAAKGNCGVAKSLADAGVHKQIVNRLLEPFSCTHMVLSGTEWDNFYKLRCAKDAQPEMRALALKMKKVQEDSEPEELEYNQWHLPYITEEDKEKYSIRELCKISAARCARVSYKLYDGSTDVEKDLELFNKLSSLSHYSPLEHQATPTEPRFYLSSNFKGWNQFRQIEEFK